MTIQPERLTALLNPEEPLHLAVGQHTSPEAGMCLLGHQ